MCLSYHAGHHCSSKHWQMSKTIDDHSQPLAFYIAPSSTMRSSQWGGGFLISTNLISPWPAAECGVFSNGPIPSSSGEQIGALAIACIVFGRCLRVTPTNNLRGAIPFLALAPTDLLFVGSQDWAWDCVLAGQTLHWLSWDPALVLRMQWTPCFSSIKWGQ